MLASAVVHYFHQYMPGLIYVAVSRVKSLDTIQILNFSAQQLLKPHQKITLIKHITFPSDVLDGPMLQCSEDEDVAAPQELLDVYKASVNSSESTRRILIKSRDHLLAMNASPSSIASTLVEEKYRAVNFLLTDNYWLKVQCLAELMWFHSFLIIEKPHRRKPRQDYH